MFDLKVGDPVFVVTGDSMRRTFVERETKTMFITRHGGRYKKTDGKQVGCDGYFTPKLEQWTQEKDDAFTAKIENSKADKLLISDDAQKRMRALPLDVKQQIIELLNAHSDSATK